MAIIAKNITASGVMLADLSGLTIAPYGQTDLRLFFSLDELHFSTDLDDAISAGQIILNDGTRDLTLEESLEHASVYTSYENVHDFLDLDDTPATYSGYAGSYIRVTPSGLSLEYIDNTLENLTDVEDYDDQGGKYLRVKGDESGIEYVDIDGSAPVTASGMYLHWSQSPTFNGEMRVLGWYHGCHDNPVTVISESPHFCDEKGFHSHYVFNVTSVTGAPFTTTVSGLCVNEATAEYFPAGENITITGTGYYQTDKSFISDVVISIVEAGKSYTMDMYRTTYWDCANRVFRVNGCRLEWEPDQTTWGINVQICHHLDDGSLYHIDHIDFADTDTVERAARLDPGKYKRTDYNRLINGADAEGLVVLVDQFGISYFNLYINYGS